MIFCLFLKRPEFINHQDKLLRLYCYVKHLTFPKLSKLNCGWHFWFLFWVGGLKSALSKIYCRYTRIFKLGMEVELFTFKKITKQSPASQSLMLALLLPNSCQVLIKNLKVYFQF